MTTPDTPPATEDAAQDATERLQAAADALPDTATDEDLRQTLAAEKARIAADAWSTHPGRNEYGHLSITLPGGRDITIGHVEAVQPSDGIAYIDVWTGPPAGPPQYRIVNPPLLVPDPHGDITITEARGRTRRYRSDPMAAIADAITGGAR
ncbi:hypothetical protein [Actinomadura sp. K4S16]|uniref:hypothetical protein n=1 Tax=Actinomadura sp. K4S16 TaxID=1316147 RepID=UPI0011EBE6BE|nr:hypothetical protein [Actinomadura sp. K4S16]